LSYYFSRFSRAVECYSEAIKYNSKDISLFSNRAQAYINLMAFPEALKDCEECIKLKSNGKVFNFSTNVLLF